MLLDASGLQPSAKGWRIRYSGDKTSFVDGPFTETKELIAGYTLIQAKSREEAIEWTRRFPNPAVDGKAGEIEVRQLFELDDFEPSAAIERFRELEVKLREGQVLTRRASTMLKIILFGIVVAIAAVLAYAATRPDTFRVQRTARIDAPPEKIFPLIDDLRSGEQWSPYYRKDPAMKGTYTGPASGPGARSSSPATRTWAAGA